MKHFQCNLRHLDSSVQIQTGLNFQYEFVLRNIGESESRFLDSVDLSTSEWHLLFKYDVIFASESEVPHEWMICVARRNESCQTYKWVTSDISMIRATHLYRSCHARISLSRGHVWHIRYELRVSRSCHGCVMPHTWMRHVAHIIEAFPYNSLLAHWLVMLRARMTHAYCNTLQHTATHCNTLQHTATHGNTRQHTASHCITILPHPHHTASQSYHTLWNLWTLNFHFLFSAPLPSWRKGVRFFPLFFLDFYDPT